MLDVSLLGEQHISGASAAGRRCSARSIGLLAFLALHEGMPQPRQHLAAVFWPDSARSQARTNLRHALHDLRVLLGDDASLVADTPTLMWRDSPTCRVDLRVFVRAYQDAMAAVAVHQPAAMMAHAAAAVAEYRGDLLPGLYDDWVVDQREPLRRQAIDLCDRLMAGWRAAGDLDRAIGFARQRIQLAPLEEVGYRAVMELQVEAGDRAAAIGTFRQCAAMLERELHVQPSLRTVEAYQRLSVPGALLA